MPRSLALWIAFTTAGSMFALVLLLAAVRVLHLRVHAAQCGQPHVPQPLMADHQVPMGLLDAFVVTDPEAAAEPATDIDYTMIINDGPLGFTLNGKGFPATEPIVAVQGQTIRVRYMNEGLQIHPMHLHGMRQLVIAKDGYLLPDPHFEDTVLVAPGERIES